MEIKTLEDRTNFLKNVKSKQGFIFNYLCDFSNEIDAIKKHLEITEHEWFGYPPETLFHRTHKEVTTHEIVEVPNRAQIKVPYISKIVTRDLKLLELCKPIVKKLESIFINGKVVNIGINRLPAGKTMSPHWDQGYESKNDQEKDFVNQQAPYMYIIRRIHVPIQTNDKTFFRVGGEVSDLKEIDGKATWIQIGGEVKNMKVGECWEFNNNLQHEVWNDGNTDRLHLIIDLLPYKWL